MIHYIFDLDDTLIIHQKGVRLNYNDISVDNTLKNLLNDCNLIEFETNRGKIPEYIKSVPTIIAQNLSKPLIGIETINWINNKKYFNYKYCIGSETYFDSRDLKQNKIAQFLTYLERIDKGI